MVNVDQYFTRRREEQVILVYTVQEMDRVVRFNYQGEYKVRLCRHRRIVPFPFPLSS